MATHSERRAQTRQKILKAAAMLFSKQGFDDTTIAQIIARAKIVKGTFYQHFDSKTDLLVALGRRDGAERVQTLIDSVQAGASALDALQRYYHVLAQWFEANAVIAEDVIICAIRQHDPSRFTPTLNAHDFSQLMLQTAQARGEIRNDITPLQQAIAIGGAFTLAVINWAKQPQTGLLQQHTQACLKLYLDGSRSTDHNGGETA